MRGVVDQNNEISLLNPRKLRPNFFIFLDLSTVKMEQWRGHLKQANSVFGGRSYTSSYLSVPNFLIFLNVSTVKME